MGKISMVNRSTMTTEKNREPKHRQWASRRTVGRHAAKHCNESHLKKSKGMPLSGVIMYAIYEEMQTNVNRLTLGSVIYGRQG